MIAVEVGVGYETRRRGHTIGTYLGIFLLPRDTSRSEVRYLGRYPMQEGAGEGVGADLVLLAISRYPE